MTGRDGQGLSESWVIFKVWDYTWQRPRGIILEHRIRCVCIFPFPLCTCIFYAFHIFSAINTYCFFHSRRKCFSAWQELHRWRRKKSAKSLSSLSCVTNCSERCDHGPWCRQHTHPGAGQQLPRVSGLLSLWKPVLPVLSATVERALPSPVCL